MSSYDEGGESWGGAPSVGGSASTFLPVGHNSPIILGSDDNAVIEDGGTNPVGNVLDNDTDVSGSGVLGVSAVNGVADNVGEPVDGLYGTLQLNPDGSYVYTLDNDNDAVQALGEGQTAAEAQANLQEAVEGYFSGADPAEIGERWIRDHRAWRLDFSEAAG